VAGALAAVLNDAEARGEEAVGSANILIARWVRQGLSDLLAEKMSFDPSEPSAPVDSELSAPGGLVGV
jgi:hypothetical protein